MKFTPAFNTMFCLFSAAAVATTTTASTNNDYYAEDIAEAGRFAGLHHDAPRLNVRRPHAVAQALKRLPKLAVMQYLGTLNLTTPPSEGISVDDVVAASAVQSGNFTDQTNILIEQALVARSIFKNFPFNTKTAILDSVFLLMRMCSDKIARAEVQQQIDSELTRVSGDGAASDTILGAQADLLWIQGNCDYVFEPLNSITSAENDAAPHNEQQIARLCHRVAWGVKKTGGDLIVAAATAAKPTP